MSDTIEKVSIIISKGSLEGVYPGLIMANGARMEGIEANVFFTFFGMDAINRKLIEAARESGRQNMYRHAADLARLHREALALPERSDRVLVVVDLKAGGEAGSNRIGGAAL